MRQADPQEMSRWLRRRKRERWTWAQLFGWSGHPIWKLRYRHRRLDHSSGTAVSHTEAFVAVEIVATRTSIGTPIEVSTPSGYGVQIPKEFDAKHLRRVLDCLDVQRLPAFRRHERIDVCWIGARARQVLGCPWDIG